MSVELPIKKCIRCGQKADMHYTVHTKVSGTVDVKICGHCAANFIHHLLAAGVVQTQALVNYANRQTDLTIYPRH